MRRSHRVLRVMVACILVALAIPGCTGAITSGNEARGPVVDKSDSGILKVATPRMGELVGTRSVSVTGQLFSDSLTEVVLNGSTKVTVGPDHTWSGAVDMPEGQGTITVTAADLSVSVSVEVDSVAPVLTMTSPDEASFVQGQDVHFKGTVTDAHLASLVIGDDEIPVDANGAFDVIIPEPYGPNHLRITATDTMGHEAYGFSSFIAGQYVSTYKTQPDAIVVKLGTRSIDAISAGVTPYLTSANIGSVLARANPLVEDWWGRVDVMSEHHDVANVKITPQKGYLDVMVSILNARIPYRLDHFLPGVITGDVTADYIEVRGKIGIYVDSSGPHTYVSDADVSLLNFYVNMNGWPDVIDRGFVSDIARKQVAESIRSHVAVMVPDVVNAALAKLPIGANISVMGHSGKVTGALDFIGVSKNGIRAALNVSVSANTRDWDLTAGAPGPLIYGYGAAPSAGTNTDLEASITLDILNAALYAAWSSGGLRHRLDNLYASKEKMTPLTVGTLSLIVPGVTDLASKDAPISVEVSAALPPVLKPKDGALVSVAIPDLRVTFYARDPAKPGDTFLATLSVGAEAPVAVGIVKDTISVAVGNYTFSADPVGQAPRGLPRGEKLDKIVRDLIEPYVKEYTHFDGLRIPSVMGYRVNASSAALVGGYFRAQGRLVRP